MKITIAIPVPVFSRIVVEEEEKVAKNTPLARINKKTTEKTIHLAKLLRIEPAKMQKFMLKKAGQKVYIGDILAEKKGLFYSSTIKSPLDGVIAEINLKTGTLLLSSLDPDNSGSDLRTPVEGVVKKLKQDEILLETEGLEFTGVLGAGDEVMGDLIDFQDKADIFAYDARVENKIVVSDNFTDEVISKIEVLEAVGLISSGVLPATTLSYLRIDNKIRDKLSQFSGKTVWLRPSKKQIVILD